MYLFQGLSVLFCPVLAETGGWVICTWTDIYFQTGCRTDVQRSHSKATERQKYIYKEIYIQRESVCVSLRDVVPLQAGLSYARRLARY